jgi:glycosyltransferase involved in cell wall biosynthesis
VVCADTLIESVKDKIMMSKVSVVIPVYNQGQYLARAIESVLNQTYADVEVVVVNDGSTDESEKIAGAYLKDPRFKYISQENRGLPAARNRGMAESSGSYLCFLDSDDYYHADKIARQVAILDDDSRYGFSYCDIFTVDEMEALVSDQYDVAKVRTELTGNIFQSLMIGGYFPPHTVMVRREVLEKVGLFDEELGGHADYDLWLRISAAGYPAYFSAEKLAFYRTYPTSMSKDIEHMNTSRIKTLEKIIQTNPELIANALSALQLVNEELHSGNQWLNQRWKELAEQIPQLNKADSRKLFLLQNEPVEQIPLIDIFHKAKVISGNKEQAAIWDVELDGKTGKALFLDAPAQLEYNLPATGKCKLVFSLALHPQVWENPESGACKFIVIIDREVALSVTIDPVRNSSQRCWHNYMIDIPQNSLTMRSVVFASQAVGPTQSFRWACWGNPTWMILGE